MTMMRTPARPAPERPDPPAKAGGRTVRQQLTRAGVSRRAFLEFCTELMVAAPFGLAITEHLSAEGVARDVGRARRPSVIWLHFQDCTGCSETLLRPSKPDLWEVILNVISLDYHETLMAGSGAQAERSLHDALQKHDGEFILVVEGSIPEKDQGIYMQIGGKPAVQMLREIAPRAAAIVAIGSCAAWGGIPSAGENPTGATGVDSVVKGRPIVNLPGCPPNPYTLLGVILQYARHGRLPALDAEKRPLFAYDRLIHDHCPRRGHFDAGRFAKTYGDQGHREGWCLYELGCKGPDTHAGCSTRHFNDIPDAWPIGIGAPCMGCTEKHLAFRVPISQVIPIYRATPPASFPPIDSPEGRPASLATGVAGLIVGAAAGAAWMAAQRLKSSREALFERPPEPPPAIPGGPWLPPGDRSGDRPAQETGAPGSSVAARDAAEREPENRNKP
jgi:hydrogenase small subunit